MKKTLKYISILILIVVSIQFYNYYKNNSNVKNIRYNNLSQKIKQISFSKEKNYVLYFDPDCGYCSELLKKIKLNEDSSIICVTPNKNISLINAFIKKNNISNNIVYIDSNDSFAKDFGLGFIIKIPTILLINNKREVKNITDEFVN